MFSLYIGVLSYLQFDNTIGRLIIYEDNCHGTLSVFLAYSHSDQLNVAYLPWSAKYVNPLNLGSL